MKEEFGVYDGHKVSKVEFAEKMAQAIKELRSSHAFFILQYAFGEMEWKSAEGILRGVLGKGTKGKARPVVPTTGQGRGDR